MRSIIGTICCFLIFNCAEVHPLRRIFGGSKADEGQFPYVVLVDGRIVCGGSILNETTILTAAHCVCNETFKPKVVRVGSNQWKTGGNIYRVDRIVCHDKYTISPIVHDIALVKLKNPIKYSNNIKAVKLPMSNVADNTDLIFAGWGATAPNDIPDNLQYINLKTVKCPNYNGKVNNTVLCTKAGVGYGTCIGDSGGPLMEKDGTQYGINSAHINECGSGKAIIFTNVFNYKNWIETKMS